MPDSAMDRPPELLVSVFGDFQFKVEEVWPDGDAPDPITADAVAARIRESGGLARWISEWNLDHSIGVNVRVTTGNPNYAQDEVLFGDRPDKYSVTRVEGVFR